MKAREPGTERGRNRKRSGAPETGIACPGRNLHRSVSYCRATAEPRIIAAHPNATSTRTWMPVLDGYPATKRPRTAPADSGSPIRTWPARRGCVARKWPGVAGRVGSVLALAGLMACAEVGEVAERLFDNRTPRERYEASLQLAGLERTAIVQDWQAAAQRALHDAAPIQSPHVEAGYLAPGEPAALGFRISARRGQQIHFDVDLAGDTAALLFLDAWQVESDTAVAFRHVTSADSAGRVLEFEPRRDGDYILRVQPELLRGGRFSISIEIGPTLAFPVQNARDHDIGSDFGDPRDGGVRDHHGVDIFAPRGTPAIATSDATVTRVQETPRGGRVVWMTDDHGNRLYYAHLDQQLVSRGQRVAPGDTIGLIGNTGNARTTPPHLHFGVYRRGEGPVDPYWFVARNTRTLPHLAADTTMLGGWARVARTMTQLRVAPYESAPRLADLPRNSAVRIIGAFSSWFRVRLPDGATGYVDARATEPANRAYQTAALDAPSALLARPLGIPAPTDVIARATTGDSVAIYGRFGDFLLVRAPDGRPAWVVQ